MAARGQLRGYDRDEVTAFLAEVAADYEAALQDADKMRQEVARLDGLVNERREIGGLRLKRREVETSVKSPIASLTDTLDSIHDHDRRDRDALAPFGHCLLHSEP